MIRNAGGGVAEDESRSLAISQRPLDTREIIPRRSTTWRPAAARSLARPVRKLDEITHLPAAGPTLADACRAMAGIGGADASSRSR